MTPCIGVSSKRKEFSYPFIHFPNRREKTKEQRKRSTKDSCLSQAQVSIVLTKRLCVHKKGNREIGM